MQTPATKDNPHQPPAAPVPSITTSDHAALQPALLLPPAINNCQDLLLLTSSANDASPVTKFDLLGRLLVLSVLTLDSLKVPSSGVEHRTGKTLRDVELKLLRVSHSDMRCGSMG